MMTPDVPVANAVNAASTSLASTVTGSVAAKTDTSTLPAVAVASSLPRVTLHATLVKHLHLPHHLPIVLVSIIAGYLPVPCIFFAFEDAPGSGEKSLFYLPLTPYGAVCSGNGDDASWRRLSLLSTDRVLPMHNHDVVTFYHPHQLWFIDRHHAHYLDLTRVKEGWKDGGAITNTKGYVSIGVCYASDGQVLLGGYGRLGGTVDITWIHGMLPPDTLSGQVPTSHGPSSVWTNLYTCSTLGHIHNATIDPVTDEMLVVCYRDDYTTEACAFDRHKKRWCSRSKLVIPHANRYISCVATSSAVVVHGFDVNDNAVPLEWYDHKAMKWQQWFPWDQWDNHRVIRHAQKMLAVEDSLIFICWDNRSSQSVALCYLVRFDPLATKPPVVQTLPSIMGMKTVYSGVFTWTCPHLDVNWLAGT